jgi:hypothetical protein
LSSPNANAGPVDDKNGQTQVNTDSTTDAKFSPEERAEYDGGYKQDFQTTSAEAKTAKTIGRALDNASDVPKEVAPAVKAGLWEAFKLWLTDGASRILSSGKVIKEIPLLRKVAPAAKDAQAGAADGKIAAQFERQNVNITGHRAAEATESSGIGSFSSRCASCCFSGDTPILAEGGLVRIDQLHVGDRVEARDEKTGRTALKRVANVIVSQNRELYGLTLLEEHGRVTRVEVTDNHPFWVTGRGWVQSIDLKRGMNLVNFDHQLVTVVNLDDLGRKATTYNLTVDGYHTFFAGESLALVHNAGGCCGAGRLVFNKATREWTSPAGLIYGQGSIHGNRVLHVLDHLVPNTSKSSHTLFNVDRTELVGLLDEAWLARGSPLANDPGAFLVPMGKVVGQDGEMTIKIIVRPNTSELISAYPVK